MKTFFSTLLVILVALFGELVTVSHAQLLDDWSSCLSSSECGTGCCTGKYSDGVLKCTPLESGFSPVDNACVEGSSGQLLDDWSSCSSSSECGTGCCTGKYSEGVLKCTPLESGFSPVDNGCVTGSSSPPPPNNEVTPDTDTTASNEGDASGDGTELSKWACYSRDPIMFKGFVEIWWGHEPNDAAWACDNWIGDCMNGASCRAILYSTTSPTGQVSVASTGNCVGNRGTCTAVYNDEFSIQIPAFRNDAVFEKVEGCGGGFKLAALGFDSDGGVMLGIEGAKVYQEWNGCCAAAGDSLEQRGLLSPGWKCAENAELFSAGIWLLGKEGCYKKGTACFPGTTCNFCCNDYNWYGTCK